MRRTNGGSELRPRLKCPRGTETLPELWALNSLLNFTYYFQTLGLQLYANTSIALLVLACLTQPPQGETALRSGSG